jgi:electron transfer flavoprotein alpha subunit
LLNIVVCVKQAPDTAGERTLRPGDATLDREAVDGVINELDEYAIEEALQIAETHGGEVTVLTMGPEKATESIRKALSMGAGKAVHLVDDALAGSDALQTSYALAQVLGTIGFDLVLVGAESTDARMGAMAAMLAERLGVPQLSLASKVDIDGSVKGLSMAEVLVLAEHNDGEVKKVTLELLTLARQFGKPAAVWAGGGAVDGQPRLAEFGAAKVYVADGDRFTDYVTAPKAELLAHLVAEKSPAAVLIASTRHNKEVAGRLAVKTNSGLLADAVGLTAQYGKIVAEQSVFGGATIVHSAVKRGTPVITVRPNSAAHEPASAAADVEHVDVEVSESAKGARITRRVVQERGERPELAEAAAVVSGGRGVGSAEGFELIEKLADAVGAAVGASRTVTDAGWYPHKFQAGQTGCPRPVGGFKCSVRCGHGA